MAKTAITNVHVFNGQELSKPGTVCFEDGLIVDDSSAAEEIIDGEGGVLLPGLIDGHVHLRGEENLKQLATWGVTTALDMATWPAELVEKLRTISRKGGIADFRTPGLPAIAPGSGHSRMLPGYEDELVGNAEAAKKYVEKRVSEGVDYIKIIADVPGFEQSTINTIVSEARTQGKKTIAHAAHYAAYERAIEGRVDYITHIPLDQALDASVIDQIKFQKIIAIPTLSMMEKISYLKKPGNDYTRSRDSVKAMYEAGIPIVAGTDSNDAPGAPASVKHGESIHHELELLIEAGLSNLKVLRAATTEPAKYFGLNDRGVIENGKRADLVLIQGDPLQDITNTRDIKRVWCKGVEVDRQ